MTTKRMTSGSVGKPKVQVRDSSPKPTGGWSKTYGVPSQIGVANDLQRLEDLLGDKFDIVEKIRDYYIKKLEEKDKTIENLRIYYVHLPPYPDDRPPVQITSTDDLLEEAIKTESYKNKYLLTESEGDMMGRLELLAYLDIIRDFKGDDFNGNPESYFNTAIAEVETRVNYFLRQAREEKIPFARWVNENIKFDDLY